MNQPAEFPSDHVLRHAYDEAAVGLCYLDRDLRYLNINKWLASLNGLSVEEHLGRKVHEVVPEVAKGIENQLRLVMETNTPIIDGTVKAATPAQPAAKRTFMHNYIPVVDGNGEVVGVSCLVQDITSRPLMKGTFPICSDCKSIRDHKGLWHQLEAYVSKHSEAEFSHGICPSCMENLQQ